MTMGDSGCRSPSKRPHPLPRTPSHPGLLRTLLLASFCLLLLPTSAKGSTSEPQHGYGGGVGGGGYMETSLMPPTTTTVPTCLDKEDLKKIFNREVKPRRLYVNEKEEVLTMLSSGRVPQQLMTRIVAILLKDFLGYVNLTITTVPNTFHPSSIVDAMKLPEARKELSRYVEFLHASCTCLHD
ncbi:hypothetical protein SK128_014580 [Halocaridina rubra]|uniref:Uncharacterized protein n=1 Tax=Halocaridina rubra TaxID=373956 RepID=A0AAN8ZQ70_HALRR